jgi:hypothetical protein
MDLESSIPDGHEQMTCCGSQSWGGWECNPQAYFEMKVAEKCNVRVVDSYERSDALENCGAEPSLFNTSYDDDSHCK